MCYKYLIWDMKETMKVASKDYNEKLNNIEKYVTPSPT